MNARLDSHLAALGALCAAGAAPANAAVVFFGAVNINIPSNVDGVYLNVVTGVTGSSSAATPGWDVNPWSGTGLGFFSPTAPAGGAYVVTAAGFVANLWGGAIIDAGSQFGSGQPANTGMWNYNSSVNIVGFRFNNEITGQIHYGWMQLALSETATAQPRAIVAYAYEDTPGLPISLFIPGTPTATLALAAGLAGLSRRRGRQR